MVFQGGLYMKATRNFSTSQEGGQFFVGGQVTCRCSYHYESSGFESYEFSISFLVFHSINIVSFQ